MYNGHQAKRPQNKKESPIDEQTERNNRIPDYKYASLPINRVILIIIMFFLEYTYRKSGAPGSGPHRPRECILGAYRGVV